MIKEIKINEYDWKKNWIDQNNVVFGFSDQASCCESWGWGVYDPDTKQKIADSPDGMPYHFDFGKGAEEKGFIEARHPDCSTEQRKNL